MSVLKYTVLKADVHVVLDMLVGTYYGTIYSFGCRHMARKLNATSWASELTESVLVPNLVEG